jgi:hypothetical protein
VINPTGRVVDDKEEDDGELGENKSEKSHQFVVTSTGKVVNDKLQRAESKSAPSSPVSKHRKVAAHLVRTKTSDTFSKTVHSQTSSDEVKTKSTKENMMHKDSEMAGGKRRSKSSSLPRISADDGVSAGRGGSKRSGVASEPLPLSPRDLFSPHTTYPIVCVTGEEAKVK